VNDTSELLSSVRVIESSLLGPGHVATFFADLGADVIKVESPKGDYIRQMTWPIVNGVSLLHLHTHRGKRSIALDLKTEQAKALYLDLVAEADVVVEAMRPGTLARLGLGYGELSEVNPKIVFATLSGYGATGPYKDMPSHGIAYDTWSGIVQPVTDDDGFARIPPDMPNVGINVGPMLAAVAVLAAVIAARETGIGCELELAQSDASAYMDWYRIESERAYLRPADEVTGNPADDYERRPAGLAGMWEGVRYQMYATADGHVLFMASEQAFWRNFCAGIQHARRYRRRSPVSGPHGIPACRGPRLRAASAAGVRRGRAARLSDDGARGRRAHRRGARRGARQDSSRDRLAARCRRIRLTLELIWPPRLIRELLISRRPGAAIGRRHRSERQSSRDLGGLSGSVQSIRPRTGQAIAASAAS